MVRGTVQRDRASLLRIFGDVRQAIAAREIADARRRKRRKRCKGAVDARAGAGTRRGLERGAGLDQRGDRLFECIAFR